MRLAWIFANAVAAFALTSAIATPTSQADRHRAAIDSSVAAGDDDETIDIVEPGPVYLTAAQRRTRAELIRDSAATHGMMNAALLAGIGEVETNFAHCWSEATWACKGPASATCDGGPVIAGSADGPCSSEQGGLGMFQFDSGTYSQTIATYGPDIVTMQGNVGAVIPFLVTRAIESVEGVNSEAEAIAWMNSIEIADGNAKYETWLYFVAWRYNGCKGCTTQINKYRAGTNKLATEFGAEFWRQAAPTPNPKPDPDPDGGDGTDPDDDGSNEIVAGPCSGGPGNPSSELALLGLAGVAVTRRRRRAQR